MMLPADSSWQNSTVVFGQISTPDSDKVKTRNIDSHPYWKLESKSDSSFYKLELYFNDQDEIVFTYFGDLYGTTSNSDYSTDCFSNTPKFISDLQNQLIIPQESPISNR